MKMEKIFQSSIMIMPNSGLKLCIRSFIVILTIQQFSCKKFVQVSPPITSVTGINAFSSDETATSVLTGIYGALTINSPLRAFALNCLSMAAGLSADELTLYGGASNGNQSLREFFQNRLLPGLSSSPPQVIWSDLYARIYVVNLALEKLNSSNSLTASVKQQLTGEAKFLRAFSYFYLVNLYGNVPLATSSDYRITNSLFPTLKDNVYKQIQDDLKDAQNLLTDNYVGGDAKTVTTERLRPNKWVATALLSRVYLYTNQWADAEIQANNIIANTTIYDTVSLINVFLKNSKEAIWQLQPVNLGWNTEDARVFILPSTGPTSNSSVEGYPVYLCNQLLNTFESNDKRKTSWINNVTVGSGPTSATYYYPYKYKSATLNAPVTEYTLVLRLGEQYLIRAEARAHLNKISEGLSDLNIIRRRAGLPDATATDQATLLNLIYHERQVELFTEWGHRWLDLKRTGKVDEVMSAYAPAKGTTWSPNWALYPIPLYDITQNPNLKQNPGY